MPARKQRKQTKKAPDSQEQLKRERIEILVAEVENAFESFREDLNAKHKIERERVENQHRLLLASLPQEIKNMRLVDFMEKGMDFKTILAPQPVQKVDSSTVLAKFMKKAEEPKRKKSFGPATEESKRKKSFGPASVVASKKKVLASKRKSKINGMKKSRVSGSRHSKILPSSSRVSRNGYASSGNESYVDISDDEVFFTPSHKHVTSCGPITPKIPPGKLLMRSQVRHPRAGEVTFSLSGSPVSLIGQQDKQFSKSVSLKTQVEVGKKVYHFSEPEKTGGRLGIKDRRRVLDLQRHLDQLLKN